MSDPHPSPVADGHTTLTFWNGQTMNLVLKANTVVTFDPRGLADRHAFNMTLRTVQDSTGGHRLTLPCAPRVRWPGGVVPPCSSAPGSIDVWTFVSIDGATFDGFCCGQDMR